MCLTCGCLLPYDDHENPDRLTMDDLERSAKADHLTLAEAVGNLIDTFEAIYPPPGKAQLSRLGRRKRL